MPGSRVTTPIHPQFIVCRHSEQTSLSLASFNISCIIPLFSVYLIADLDYLLDMDSTLLSRRLHQHRFQRRWTLLLSVRAPDSVCCLVLQSNFALLLTIQFASLFFFFFYFFSFFCQDFVRPISEPLLAETPNRVCAESILHCCLPSNSLCCFATILSGYLWNRYFQIELSNCALLLTIQFASFFRHDFVRAISLFRDSKFILHCCLPFRFVNFFINQYFSLSHHVRVFHLRGIAPRLHCLV